MNVKEERRQEDTGLYILAFFGWVLPLAGFVWGPGEWWQYLVWLAIGTVVLIVFDYYTNKEEA